MLRADGYVGWVATLQTLAPLSTQGGVQHEAVAAAAAGELSRVAVAVTEVVAHTPDGMHVRGLRLAAAT